GVLKKINYTVEESETDKGWDETYANHVVQQKKYEGKLKPITIVVTDRIVTCVQVWNELVGYLMETEELSREQAEKKVIWVASGLPSNTREKNEVKALVSEPDKARKANLLALKTVDEFESDVEWIVSVSMLTEGWDVKNVFQIVPHEQRAFCSRLLISQVLGRGLRIPAGLEQPVHVTINNHERWTNEIRDLYRGVLETETRISWGVAPEKGDFLFPLYNLTYSSQQDSIETKEKAASEPDKVVLVPQEDEREEVSEYSETGTFRFRVQMRNKVPMQQAVREMKLFLKDHDPELARKWTVSKIEQWIKGNLEGLGYTSDWVSRENLGRLKTAFGPMFRSTGKQVPRMKLRPDGITEVKMETMHRQSFSESQLRNQKGYLFFDDHSAANLDAEEKELLTGFLEDRTRYDQVREAQKRYGGSEHDIFFLKENMIEVPRLIGPQNLLFVISKPETQFVKLICHVHADKFDSFVKSPDRAFYEVPYSYKPTEKAASHVQRENFNPDFLLRINGQNRILVVEIKDDHDDSKKNRAKNRDAIEHFDQLNTVLSENGIDWTYHFFFLSPEDYSSFFNAVSEENWAWKSQLMQELE
ncbi:MAG: hypothetical protein ACO3NW_04055, partial [Kiritimatiellia bacterium]